MQTFEELYLKLNPEQRKAVDTIEGPVMVIAGPGTGKTQILATRILNILRQPDTKPENILCLTYTEAGATAMRQRLSTFMGTDSYRVNIHTFHGLCNKLISERPDLYSKRDLRVMDDLERLEILQTIIESLPHESSIKVYDSYSTNLNSQLLKTWDILQEQQLTPEILEQYVTKLQDEEFFKACFPKLVYKVNTKNGKKGDIKKGDYDTLMSQWQKLIEVAKLLPVYQAHKAENGVYEFHDMIEWVLNRLLQDEDYKLSIQERFQYVLVDEFQDTSYQQGEILRLLTDYWGEEANCFVVGDDDQSIYAFQGARVGNMIEFKNRYKHTLTTVVLTHNYRSTQAILDASNRLIQHNTLRLVNTEKGLSKILTAAGDNQDFEPIEPTIKSYNNEFHEVLGVTQSIQELLKNGISPEKIAILYPKHRLAESYVDIFRERNIPFILNRKLNILTEPIIHLVLDWLNYLDRELQEPHSGEYLLYPILASNLYPFSAISLSRLSADIYQYRKEFKSNQYGLPYSWREHLIGIKENQINADYLNQEEKQTLKLIFQSIETWIKNAASMNVGTLVAQVFSELGFIAMATKDSDSHWLLEVLHSFLSYVNQQCERFPFMTLKQLLVQVELMKSASIEINLEKRIGNADGIQFFSAHGSKGLEFDHVFMIGGLDKDWIDGNSAKFPYKIRELLGAHRPSQDSVDTETQEIEERRRLFFVAVTRAKKSLHISYYTQKLTESKDSLVPSMFVGELDPEYFQSNPKNEQLPAESLIWAQEQVLRAKGKPVIEVDAEDWLEERLEKFTFSPSSILSILNCGVNFYFSNIVRVPSSPSEFLSYGNAMHASMRYILDTQINEKRWLELPEWLSYFEFQMHREKGSFTKTQFDSRLNQGRMVLQTLHSSKKDIYQKYESAKTEFSLQSEVEGVVLKGSIDKLVINGDTALVADYKTGKFKNIKDKSTMTPKTKDPLKKNYWLQVGIYVLMVNAHKELQLQCTGGAIESLAENEQGEFETIDLYYNSDHIDLIKELIRKADTILKERSFLNGCGKDTCHWCQFTKQHGWVKYLPSTTDILADSESEG